MWFTAPKSSAIISFDLIVFFKLPYNFDKAPKVVCSNVFQAGGNRRSSLCFFKCSFIVISLLRDISSSIPESVFIRAALSVKISKF